MAEQTDCVLHRPKNKSMHRWTFRVAGFFKKGAESHISQRCKRLLGSAMVAGLKHHSGDKW